MRLRPSAISLVFFAASSIVMSLFFVPSESTEAYTWCSDLDTNCTQSDDIHPSKNKQYRWVTGRVGAMPARNPVRAGTDPSGSPLYVCRVSTDRGIIPGKLSPKHKMCFVPFDGKEVKFAKYSVLDATDWRWVQLIGEIPRDAIVGGNDIDGENLYICSVGGAAGKYKPSHDVCYVPYDGKELNYSDFFILLAR